MNELLSCYFHFMLKYAKPKKSSANGTLELPKEDFLIEQAMHIKRFQMKHNNLTMASQFHLIVLKLKKIHKAKNIKIINKEVMAVNAIYEKMMFEMTLQSLFDDELIDKKDFKLSKLDETTSEIYYQGKLVYCGDYISRKRLGNTKLDIITVFLETGENWLFNDIVSPLYEMRYNAMIDYLENGTMPSWASEEYQQPDNNKNKLLLDLYKENNERIQ